MKSILKNILSVFIILILFALFIYYVINNLDDFKKLSNINPLFLIPIIFLFLVNYYCYGIQTNVLLEPLGIKLKHLEAFFLSIITGFYNIITPANGGMAIRAVYLKKNYHLTYTNFISNLAGMYLITFLIGSATGLLSSLFIYIFSSVYNMVLIIIFICIFIPLLGIAIFSPEIKETKHSLLNKFIQVINGWNLIKNHRNILFSYYSLTILNLIINAIIFLLSYKILNINISIFQGLLLSAISSISILIRFTPGNLGIQETISVFSATVIGIEPTESITVALIIRLMSVLPLLLLGPILSYFLLKKRD